MAHTKKHTMRQNIAKSNLKVRQNRPPTRKRTPFSKTEYLWPDGRYRNQRPPLQSKGLASNNKVEKKVNKVEKKPVKVEKKVNKVEKKVEKKVEPKKETPKYKQVSQKELDAKVKEMSKPKKKPDPLKDYRRGEGTKLGKDTRITKHLKSKGWTEDRLAAKRKAHAEWKANRKKKKNKLKIGG